MSSHFEVQKNKPVFAILTTESEEPYFKNDSAE